jgi:hypothetical protein
VTSLRSAQLDFKSGICVRCGSPEADNTVGSAIVPEAHISAHVLHNYLDLETVTQRTSMITAKFPVRNNLKCFLLSAQITDFTVI